MKRTSVFFLLLTFFIIHHAQNSPTSSEFEAQIIGGNNQLVQVLQTQLNIPKTILNTNFNQDVIIFFNIDSIGKACDVIIENKKDAFIGNEIKRMLLFLKFKKTIPFSNLSSPYFIKFNVSKIKYNNYFKQKSKINLKINLSADSSFIIYSKADKSPEYYKNGDEGLADFILSEIEYPKLAIEKSIEGTVTTEFIIETNGYVSNLIIKNGIGAGCSEEALRIIKQTKWQPAVINNKLVRYKTTYPITFSLRNVNKDNGSSSQSLGQ